MSDKSAIEWTDASWNPVRADNGRHICARISPGCDRCYASTMTRRLAGVAYGKVGEPLASQPLLDQEALRLPIQWVKPRRIFVCSMTDLFGEWMTDEWLDQIFAVMAFARRHTFQVLTKRPKRMQSYLSGMGDNSEPYRDRWDAARRALRSFLSSDSDREYVGVMMAHQSWPLSNVWVGTTIESDDYAWRANYLRDTPAAVRWISAEPLISGLPSLDLSGISWLVAGGESGAGARPMHPDWARSLRDQCQIAGVAFHFKQWGEWWPSGPRIVEHARMIDFGGEIMYRLGKHRAGRELDGREWSEFPEPKAAAVSGSVKGN